MQSHGQVCYNSAVFGIKSYRGKNKESCQEACSCHPSCVRFALQEVGCQDSEVSTAGDAGDCFLYRQLDGQKCETGPKPCFTTYDLVDASTVSLLDNQLPVDSQDAFANIPFPEPQREATVRRENGHGT